MAEDSDVIRSGWVEKKSMRSFRKTGFIRRFMVLTTTRLYYLTTKPIESQRDEVHFEVNLEIINDIINRDYHEKGLGKFDVVTPSRHLTIKCPFDEKLLWIRDIQNAKDVVIGRSACTPSLYQSVPTTASIPGVGKKLKSLLVGGGRQEDGGETFTLEQARALTELHDFVCSSTDLCATIVTAVFESLNALCGPEKTRASKQLGQALAMWLGESSNHLENSHRASRLSICHAGKPSQIDILTIWLEISLVREFKDSCSFSPLAASIKAESGSISKDERVASKQTSDSGQHGEEGVNKENRNEDRNEQSLASSNIPFRRGNVECLFILSFIKSVAQNTGMLSTWLMPSLLVISQNPESFVKSKELSPEIATSQPHHQLPSPQNTSRSAEESFCVIAAESYDGEKVDNGDGIEDGYAIISKVAKKLNAEEFCHLESMKIVEKMRKTQEFIPPSFTLLVSTIFRLTVKTSDFHNCSKERGRNFSTGHEEETEEYRGDEILCPSLHSHKYESKAEYGVYYASSCATLFLRLICPALLSPLEWGVLSQKSITNHRNETLQPQPGDKREGKRDALKRLVFGKSKPDDSTCPGEASPQYSDCVSNMNKNPAAAAIILVAHILNSCNLEEFWSSNDLDLDNFLQIQSNVVRTVPIEKLNSFIEVYETKQCQSIVDPSTRKTFESTPVRKGLMELAKDIQRTANLSIAPVRAMKVQAAGVYSRLHSEKSPGGEEFEQEIDFQVEQATRIQTLYNSLGESSKWCYSQN